MPTPLPLSPFVDPDNRFVLDEEAFMAAITDLAGTRKPKFLSNPSPEYLSAVELMPIVEILHRY